MVQWHAMVARDGHWWLWVVEEEVWSVGWGFGEKRGDKCMFYAARCICSLQDSLGRNFTRLGDLAQLRLSWASFREFYSNIFHCFCTKVISHAPYVILQIPTVKTYKHRLRSYIPNYRNRFWVNLRIIQFQCRSIKLHIT